MQRACGAHACNAAPLRPRPTKNHGQEKQRGTAPRFVPVVSGEPVVLFLVWSLCCEPDTVVAASLVASSPPQVALAAGDPIFSPILFRAPGSHCFVTVFLLFPFSYSHSIKGGATRATHLLSSAHCACTSTRLARAGSLLPVCCASLSVSTRHAAGVHSLLLLP